VRVRAGEKVIDDVRTEVRDGTLRLTFEHDGFGGGDVVVEASVPKLTGIEASGAGDIDADGIDADAFEVRSDGSADIALEGTVGRLAVDLDGSGDADLAGLAARDARVAVAARVMPTYAPTSGSTSTSTARATCATTATRR
jgi:hypothetical protein